jgi:hypothetical protein
MTTARRKANALQPGDFNGAPRNLDQDRAPRALLDCFTPNPRNPRGSHPDLPGLAESLTVHGQLQPVTCVSTEVWLGRWPEDAAKPGFDFDAQMVTLIGSSRLLAARLAEREGLDYTLRDDLMDPALYPMGPIVAAAMENIARADMSPLDEARLCVQVRDQLRQGEEEPTAGQIGAVFTQSRHWVNQRLGLLRLVQSAQDLIDRRTPGLTLRVARTASALPADQQMAYLATMVEPEEGEETEGGDTGYHPPPAPPARVPSQAQARPVTRATAERFVRRFRAAGDVRELGAVLAKEFDVPAFAELVAAGAEAIGDPAALDAVISGLQAVRDTAAAAAG